MQKFLNSGIALLFFFIFSCGQQKDSLPKSTAQADTSAVEQNIQNEPAKQNVMELTYAEHKGKLLYEHYCSVCHGIKGKGDGFNSYNLNPRPKNFTEKGYLDSVTDDWLIQTISLGGRGVKRSVLMPAYAGTLSNEQIKDIVAYVRYIVRLSS